MLRSYVVHYRDPDPGCPVMTWRCLAYDKSHARDKFIDSSIDDGWEDAVIVKVERMREPK